MVQNGILLTCIPSNHIKEILPFSLHDKTFAFLKSTQILKEKSVGVPFPIDRHFVFFSGWCIYFFLLCFACCEEKTTELYSFTKREPVSLGKRRNQTHLAKLKFSFSMRELNSRLSIASYRTRWSYTERCEFNSRTEKENLSYAR